jgi:hypothetical protein
MKRWALTTCLLLLAARGLPAEDQTVRTHQVQLNGHTFTLPVDFEIELVAGPPLVDRPIIADFDEQGRLYVADSSGSNDKVDVQMQQKPHRIVRLEDTACKCNRSPTVSSVWKIRPGMAVSTAARCSRIG